MSNEPQLGEKPDSLGRRKVIIAGASLAAAPLLAGGASAMAEAAESPPLKGPFTVRAYGTKGSKEGFAPMQIQRRAVGPKDIFLISSTQAFATQIFIPPEVSGLRLLILAYPDMKSLERWLL